MLELTDTQVLQAVSPFLPPGEVAIAESTYAAQLVELDREAA